MIPKYWKISRFSFKIIDEKTALKSGENDKSGIVRLNCELLIDSKNKNAEIIFIKTNNPAGKI